MTTSSFRISTHGPRLICRIRISACARTPCPTKSGCLYFQQLTQELSQEFRLTSDQDQRLRWIVGGSYVYQLTQAGSAGLETTGVQLVNAGNPNKIYTGGVFGGLAYDIFPELTLNFEARNQWDEVQLFNHSIGKADTLAVRNTFETFLPRVMLQYRPIENSMVYISYGKGVNPGTFNQTFLNAAAIQRAALPSGTQVGLIVQPETLDDYEIGYKGRFWNGRAQITADLYYGEWTNQIVSQGFTVPAINGAGQPTGGITTLFFNTNIGQTIIKGGEIEASVLATEHLTLSGSLAYNYSHIGTYLVSSATAIIGTNDVSGHELPNAPRWSGTVGVEYDDELTADLRWSARADFIYKGPMWDSFANVLRTDPQKTVNFKLGIDADRYSFDFQVLNAFDNTAYTSAGNNSDVLTPAFSPLIEVGLPQKRQFAVHMKYRFD